MKQNNNNNENRHNVENLKAAIKADYYNEIELVKYGIQVYAAALTGDEYSVIVMAYKTGGRYYFETREGYRLPWSAMDPDTLATACRDFLDQMTADENTNDEAENVTTKEHATAARVATICETIAEAVGVTFDSSYPAADMVQDLNRFAKWQSIAADADDVIDPRAPFYFAVRRQGSESGTREHAAERCRVLGAPVYVVKVEREHNEAGAFIAGRYSLTIATDAAAAELLGLTPDTDPTTPAPADDHQDTTTTTAAEVISESEPTARPAAGSLAGRVVTAARVFLLACCLSAADGLTAAPAADDLTPCELLTADPLAEVIRLQAAGLTVSHVTIKSTTPAAC